MALSSVIRYTRALDSTATDGSGKTGLAFGDITASYLTQGGTLTSLTTETITTLGTYQAPTSNAHIRIKELNSANPTKGVYEIHIHNDLVAEAGKKLWLFFSATGAAFQPLEVDLIVQGTDHTAGIADLPTNAELATSQAAADDATLAAIAALNNIAASDVWAAATRTLTALDEDSTTIDLDAAIRAALGMASANLDTQLADIPTVAEFEARTLVAASYFDPAADTVANVTTVGSVTGAVAITSNVKKNQALAEFQFLMTDATTHAPATGLTVTCTRSIDGAAFASGTLANVAEVANGTYTVDFGAGDLNGNVIVLKATATGADATFERIITQP